MCSERKSEQKRFRVLRGEKITAILFFYLAALRLELRNCLRNLFPLWLRFMSEREVQEARARDLSIVFQALLNK